MYEIISLSSANQQMIALTLTIIEQEMKVAFQHENFTCSEHLIIPIFDCFEFISNEWYIHYRYDATMKIYEEILPTNSVLAFILHDAFD